MTTSTTETKLRHFTVLSEYKANSIMPSQLDVHNSKQKTTTREKTTDGEGRVRSRSLQGLFGTSQREFARKAGVANGTVSWIEQGRVSPSVGPLKELTDALAEMLADVSTMDRSRPAGRLLSKDQLVGIGAGDDSLQSVPPGVADAQQPVLMQHYPPRTNTGPEPTKRAGQAEKARVVAQGNIPLTVGCREEEPGTGDADSFDRRIPHRIRNLSGEDDQVLSAATPGTR